MEIQKRKNQIIQEAERLGIADNVEKKYTKTGKDKTGVREWVSLLQGHYLNKHESLMGIPDVNLRAAIKIESPMLCYRFTDLKEDEKEAVWKSTDWGFEEKHDGARMMIFYNDTQGLSFYSRHISVENYLPISYSQKIFHNTDTRIVGGKLRNFVIDTEVVCKNPHVDTVLQNRGVYTETMLQAVTSLLGMDSERSVVIQKEQAQLSFVAFDVLIVDGSDVTGCDLLMRRRILERIVGCLIKAGMNIEMTKIYFNTLNKKNYYNKIIRASGEGVVAKKVNGIYVPSARKRNLWVKIKRSVSETMGDTVDGWIVGGIPGNVGTENEGLIAGIRVAVLIRNRDGTTKEKEIAHITGLKRNVVQEISMNSDNEQQINPAYLDKIVVVDGQNFSSRSKRLRHAVLKGFRDDKTKYDCVLDESFVESNIF